MPTLADCLERIYGIKTKRPEAKFIQKQAEKYLKEGYSGKDANIGAVKRHVYVRETGETKPFVSGYSNSTIPNLWDRSADPG